MNVVINKCFGGFSLSATAIKRIAELQGRECYFFTQDISAGFCSPYLPASPEEANEAFMFFAFSVPDPNAVIGDKDFNSMTMPERKAYNALYQSISLDNRVERNDPVLIQVVKELGAQASGKHADLAIVEIPDGVEFTIEEYDGNEHVAEAHRTWYANEK